MAFCRDCKFFEEHDYGESCKCDSNIDLNYRGDRVYLREPSFRNRDCGCLEWKPTLKWKFRRFINKVFLGD